MLLRYRKSSGENLALSPFRQSPSRVLMSFQVMELLNCKAIDERVLAGTSRQSSLPALFVSFWQIFRELSLYAYFFPYRDNTIVVFIVNTLVLVNLIHKY
jgi:hypothetical protein